MPLLNQPESLYVLCERKMSKMLFLACRMFNYKLRNMEKFTRDQIIFDIQRQLQPTYSNASIPTTIRQGLLNRFAKHLSSGPLCLGQNPVPAMLLNVVLGSDIKELKVQLCCDGMCDYKIKFLHAIANHGQGLKSLKLSKQFANNNCLSTYLPIHIFFFFPIQLIFR